MIKNLPANAEDARDSGSTPGMRKSPGGGNRNTLLVFLPGKFPGQRRSRRLQSDTTEHTHTHAKCTILTVSRAEGHAHCCTMVL